MNKYGEITFQDVLKDNAWMIPVVQKVDSTTKQQLDQLIKERFDKVKESRTTSHAITVNKQTISHTLTAYKLVLHNTKYYSIEYGWVICPECDEEIKANLYAFFDWPRECYMKEFI